MGCYRIIASLLLLVALTGCGPSSLEELATEMKAGESLLDAGQYEQAAQSFQRALQIDPGHAAALVLRAKALEGQKQYSKAYAHYARAHDLHPENLQAGEAALRLELAGKHLPKAGKRLASLIELGLKKERQVFWQSKLAIAAGDMQEAARLLSTSMSTAEITSVEALLDDAEAALAVGQHERVQSDIDRVLEMDDGNYEARLLAVELALKRGQSNVAEERLTGLQADFPNDEKILMRLAAVQTSHDKLDAAIESYQRLLALPGDHPAVILALGEVLAAKGQLDDLNVLVAAIDPGRRSTEGISLYLLGLAALQAGELQKALETARKASMLLPEYAPVWVSYGQAAFGLDQRTLALKAFRKALNLDPGMLLAGLQIARIRILQGELGSARDRLAEILDQRPCHAEAEVLLAKVNLMQDKSREGLSSVDRCLSLFASGSFASDKGKFLVIKSELLLRLGKQEEALVIMQELALEFPGYSKYGDTAARLLSRLGRIAEAEAMLAKAIADGEASAIATLGLIRMTEGRQPEAEGLLSQALEIEETTFTANLQLGLLRLESGDIQTAKILLGRALERSPNDPLANQAFGILAQRDGDWPSAETYYAKALASEKNLTLSNVGMAEVLLAMGRPSDANHYASAALRRAPDSARAMLALALTQVAGGDLEKAQATFDDLIGRFPLLSEAWVQRGKLLLRLGQNLAALSDFQQAISLDAQHGLAVIGRIDARLALGQQEEAVDELELIEKEMPDDPFILRTKGTLLLRLGRTKEALAPLTHAYKIEPASDVTAMLLAQAYTRQGEEEAAMNILSSHADMATAEIPVRMMYASLLEKSDELNDAVDIYRSVNRDAPDYVPAMNNLAWVLHRLDGYDDEALKLARRAYILAPESAPLMDTLGVLLLSSGRDMEALNMLKKAAGIMPEDRAIAGHYSQAVQRQAAKGERL